MNTTLNKYESIAKGLMVKYKLTDWTFIWDKASVSRLGRCSHKKKEIGLSEKSSLIMSYDNVIDTIKHEIAHALTPGHKHDKVWKAKCLELGCIDRSTKVVNLDELAKYKGVCPTCGHTIYRGKRNKVACKTCCDKDLQLTGNKNFSKHTFVWSLNK